MEQKNNVGRPRKELDTDLIEKLASIFCTNEEISTIVGCHPDTLADNFSEYLKKGRDKGKTSLRRMQWEKCQTGNATMLIWLGKNMLGQSDQPVNTESDQVLPWSDD